ncbi:MAG: hypothetical protein NDI69_13710 [Bacteriovoracaceae bacterium]|nr:hypothetical protein [Bacteriovoracaceae bacterium]
MESQSQNITQEGRVNELTGLNLDSLNETLKALKANPELAEFKFRCED